MLMGQTEEKLLTLSIPTNPALRPKKEIRKKASSRMNQGPRVRQAASYTKVSLSINVPISSGKQAQEKVAI